MWNNLSSQDRNRFKARAMMEVKCQRVAKKETDDPVLEAQLLTQPEGKRSSDNDPLPVDVARSAKEDMCNDLLTRSMANST